MKLEVGTYVRTKDGIIAKTKTEHYEDGDSELGYFDYVYYKTDNYYNDDTLYIFEEDIIKTSHNIIDLIEVGDYVNGRKVYQVGYNFADEFVLKMSESNYEDFIYPNEIETVVTKEQFESMSYKVKE